MSVLAAVAIGSALAAGLSKVQWRKNKIGRSPVTAQQRAFAGRLVDRASGQGPSYADLQMQRAMERSQAQASSMAASARGANTGLQQLAAQQGAAASSVGIAGEAAQARLQEQDMAEARAIQALSGVRAQDMQYNSEVAAARQAQKANNRAAVSGMLGSLGAAAGREASMQQSVNREDELMEKGLVPSGYSYDERLDRSTRSQPQYVKYAQSSQPPQPAPQSEYNDFKMQQRLRNSIVNRTQGYF